MPSLNPSRGQRITEVVRSLPVDRAASHVSRFIAVAKSGARRAVHSGSGLVTTSAGSRVAQKVGALPRPKALRPDVHRVLLIVAIALTAGASVAGVSQWAAQQDNVAQGPAEVSQAIVISNLSDGRNGRPYALAGGEPLFPLPAASLAAFRDAPVEVQGSKVLSVVPDVGFWIGEDDIQRVLVVMRTPRDEAQGPLSMPSLQPGQMVNLSGYMRAVDSEAVDVGITDPSQAATLDRQKFRIEANSVRPQ